MTAASRPAGWLAALRNAGGMMVGVPPYSAYLEHMQRDHPDATPMTEAAFFRDRQNARFGEGGRGGFRCC